MPRDRFTHFLATLIFLSGIIIVVLLMFIEIPPTNRDVIFMAVGVIISKSGSIADFFFGNSKSSNDKDKMLRDTPAPGGSTITIKENPVVLDQPNKPNDQ